MKRGSRQRAAGNGKKLKLVVCALWVVLSALSPPADAQQPRKVPRIGYLSAAASFSAISARTEAFRQGLRELGYVEGKNIVIEYRYAERQPDRLPALAAELVRLKVDVIVSSGSGNTRAAKEATSAIPIVMTQDNDPVGRLIDLTFWGWSAASPIPAAILPG